MRRRLTFFRASVRPVVSFAVSFATGLAILGATATAQDTGVGQHATPSPPPDSAVEMNLDALKALRKPQAAPSTAQPGSAKPAPVAPKAGAPTGPAVVDIPKPSAKPPVPPKPPVMPPTAAPPLPMRSDGPVAPPPIVPEDATPRAEEAAPNPATAAMHPAPKELKGRQERILFTGNIPALTLEGAQALDRLAAEVVGADLRIELYAYAGTPDAPASDSRRLALKRAIAVREHLIERHIDPSRIDLHVLGPVADGGPTERVDIRFLIP